MVAADDPGHPENFARRLDHRPVPTPGGGHSPVDKNVLQLATPLHPERPDAVTRTHRTKEAGPGQTGEIGQPPRLPFPRDRGGGGQDERPEMPVAPGDLPWHGQRQFARGDPGRSCSLFAFPRAAFETQEGPVATDPPAIREINPPRSSVRPSKGDNGREMGSSDGGCGIAAPFQPRPNDGSGGSARKLGEQGNGQEGGGKSGAIHEFPCACLEGPRLVSGDLGQVGKMDRQSGGKGEQRRQGLVAYPVPEEVGTAIRRILPPRQAASPQKVQDVLTRALEQGADDAIGSRRQDAAQPPHPRATQQAEEDRLRLIIDRVAGGDRLAAEVEGRLLQEGVAGLSGTGFEVWSRQGHGSPPHAKGHTESGGQLGNGPFVLVRLRPSQSMMEVGGGNPERPAASEVDENDEESRRISPTRHRDENVAAARQQVMAPQGALDLSLQRIGGGTRHTGRVPPRRSGLNPPLALEGRGRFGNEVT